MIKYIDFIKSETAKRYKIDNNPKTRAIIENILHTLKSMDDIIKNVFDNKKIIITSGFRCFFLNKVIKGSSNSQHKKGQAIDFSISGLSPKEICDKIQKSFYSYDQLILCKNFVHISFNSLSILERKENLIKTSKGYIKVNSF